MTAKIPNIRGLLSSAFLATVISLNSGCTSRLEVSAIRTLSHPQLMSELPQGFADNEQVSSDVIGIAFDMNGKSLRKFAAGSRNPVVRYVTCLDGANLGYSFGPFVNKDYATRYVQSANIEPRSTYTVIATANSRLLQGRSACALLESRLPTGVVASSALIQIPDSGG